jgi:hypothetical protein
MIYHVLPGDAQVEEFRKTGIEGELIVCREALIYGPVDADDIDQFWNERARFIVGEYGEDEIAYHDNVARDLAKLLDVEVGDEINLWFEYELFCSVNMWFCLSLLKDTGADVYRVEPIGLDEEDRWNGFGKFTSDDLKAAFELRTKLSTEDIDLGASLWDAYRKKDVDKLRELAAGEHDAFPCLGEVAAAAAEEDIRPREIVREVVAGGETEFENIFTEFKKRAGVYGYGDVQVQKLVDQLSASMSGS